MYSSAGWSGSVPRTFTQLSEVRFAVKSSARLFACPVQACTNVGRASVMLKHISVAQRIAPAFFKFIFISLLLLFVVGLNCVRKSSTRRANRYYAALFQIR